MQKEPRAFTHGQMVIPLVPLRKAGPGLLFLKERFLERDGANTDTQTHTHTSKKGSTKHLKIHKRSKSEEVQKGTKQFC